MPVLRGEKPLRAFSSKHTGPKIDKAKVAVDDQPEATVVTSQL